MSYKWLFLPSCSDISDPKNGPAIKICLLQKLEPACALNTSAIGLQFYGKLAGKQSKNKLQLNFPIKEIYQIDIVQLYESKLFECTIEMRIETLNYFERLTSDCKFFERRN
ncbi:hypothetical protein T08_5780 [Trichinella sp. T8]|nr:hypothetical protein T08_5780 [Trichinella sp. T8]